MKVKVTVSQEKALIEGLNDFGEQIFEFNPKNLTQDQRLELSKSLICDNVFEPHKETYSAISKINLEVLKEILNELIIKRKKEEIKKAQRELELKNEELERERRQQEKIKKDIKDFLSLDLKQIYKNIIIYEDGEINTSSCAYYKAYEEYPECTEKIKEIKEIAEKKQKEFMKKKRDKIEARQKQIIEWVTQKGTENQKNRLKENLLPEEEIIQEIKKEIFKPVHNLVNNHYPIELSGICICEDYENTNCRIKKDKNKKTKLNKKEYEVLVKIREALKGYNPKIEFYDTLYYTSVCDIEREKNIIEITIEMFPFEFNEEFEM